MSSDHPLTFYDIAMRPPIEKTCSAPNPWKARFALNFKQTPYKTTWVDLPDIPETRHSLGVPAGRQFADGSDFHTLPVLHDTKTGSFVGDSFDIAVHLQETYPESGRGDLFPELKGDQKLDFEFKADSLIPLSEPTQRGKEEKYIQWARFNTHVDAAFTAHTILAVDGLKFPTETMHKSHAEFCRRAGVDSWDFFKISGDARRGMLDSLKGMFGNLKECIERDSSGPFILGDKPCYADFIVGGWLRMFSVTFPESEWEEVRGWHGGIFGKFFDALQQFSQVV